MNFKLLSLKRLLMAAVVSCSVLSMTGVSTFAAQKLYDEVKKETVTKGVVYEFNHRLTAEGWQDIHILKVDMSASNVQLTPIESATEIGLKETVLKMVTEGGALAGVNSDFFGMKGTHSASFGPTLKDGELISAGTDRNIGTNEYSTFFLDTEGNPFIDYFNIKADFYANTNSHLELASINKISEMIYPICLTRQGGTTTKDLDARFPELVKYMVQDDIITKISAKGEIVEVPENGYLIILSGSQADEVAQYFTVGQKAELRVQTSVDLEKIQTAISGAGRILTNGELSQNPGLVIKGRQPRTALGISQDKNTLILMTVDGRTHSIGATHEEMADILKEYGAFDAMHFDGGGSTTMVAKTINDENVEVKNTVSDGGQRKVMNTLGIVNNAPITGINEIVIKPSSDRVFVGNEVTLNVLGYDETYHKIDVPITEVQFTSTDAAGTFNDNKYSSGTEGKAVISATYGEYVAATVVDIMLPSTMTPNTESFNMSVGQTANLSVSGVSTEGYNAPIQGGLGYEVSDPSLGFVEGNVFTATGNGSGYIKCTMGNASCYIKISIGGSAKAVTSFEDKTGLKFSSYPSTITGGAVLSTQFYNDGQNSIELNYNLGVLDQTQAAYLNFESPINIPGTPSALKLSVYGNNSGHWLRGKVLDANNKEYVIDFSKNINWEGWQELNATLPSGVAYPIKFQTIYVASLSSAAAQNYKLLFDKLLAVYPIEGAAVPASTQGFDRKLTDINGKEDGSYYITLAGTVSSGNVEDNALYTNERKKVHERLQKESDLMIYAGKNDIAEASSVDTIRWEPAYKFYSKNNVSIVQLIAEKGGMRASSTWQWVAFKNDVISSPNKNVIFIMDKTPTNFSDAMETALFRSAMKDIINEGKNIFVVSSSGSGAWSTVKDGVRYVNIPDLWNSNGTVNGNFKILKFKITGDDIVYEIENM